MAATRCLRLFSVLLAGTALAWIGGWLCILPATFHASVTIRHDHEQMQREEKAEWDFYSRDHSFGGYFVMTLFEKVRSKAVLYPVIDTFHLTERWKGQRPLFPLPGQKPFVLELIERFKERYSRRPLAKAEAYRILLRHVSVSAPGGRFDEARLEVKGRSRSEATAMAGAVADNFVQKMAERTRRLLPDEEPRIRIIRRSLAASRSFVRRLSGVAAMIAAGILAAKTWGKLNSSSINYCRSQ